jgi:hypothetical protein
MKSRAVVLIVVFSLLTLTGYLMAVERRGAELKILKKDSTALQGELIAVKPVSLLLLDFQSAADLSVNIEEILTITIVKKSEALRGAALGLIAGLLGGFVIGGFEKSIEGPRIQAIAVYAGAIGGPAALIGAMIGFYLGKDKTIEIAEKSPEEIKAVMEKLRSQARITNFQ